jgi:hypothetical protein
MRAYENLQGKITKAIRLHAGHGKTENEKYRILAELLGISETALISLFVYGRFHGAGVEAEKRRAAYEKLDSLLPAEKNGLNQKVLMSTLLPVMLI